MAAPLLHEEGALGVLSVLDRPEQTLFSLQEMELLGLFANQAAIAVDLLLKAREAERLLGDGGGELEVVARLAAAVDALEDERREAGLRLLERPRRARSGHDEEARELPGPLEHCRLRRGVLLARRGLSRRRPMPDGPMPDGPRPDRPVSLDVRLVLGRASACGPSAAEASGPRLRPWP